MMHKLYSETVGLSRNEGHGMKKVAKIILYAVLGTVGGGISGFVVSLVLQAVIMGVFWLFIFGDNSWPSWTRFFGAEEFNLSILVIGMVVGFIAGVWLALSDKDKA